MALYFFNIHDGQEFSDDQGSEFPNLDSARTGAVVLAADLLKDGASTFWDGEQWSLDVLDANGLALFTLRFTGEMASAAGITKVPAPGQSRILE